jgi:hypothetical protein
LFAVSQKLRPDVKPVGHPATVAKAFLNFSSEIDRERQRVERGTPIKPYIAVKYSSNVKSRTTIREKKSVQECKCEKINPIL